MKVFAFEADETDWVAATDKEAAVKYMIGFHGSEVTDPALCEIKELTEQEMKGIELTDLEYEGEDEEHPSKSIWQILQEVISEGSSREALHIGGTAY
jgi:hypothetical protein